jgi:hypothetical protein
MDRARDDIDNVVHCNMSEDGDVGAWPTRHIDSLVEHSVDVQAGLLSR